MKRKRILMQVFSLLISVSLLLGTMSMGIVAMAEESAIEPTELNDLVIEGEASPEELTGEEPTSEEKGYKHKECMVCGNVTEVNEFIGEISDI